LQTLIGQKARSGTSAKRWKCSPQGRRNQKAEARRAQIKYPYMRDHLARAASFIPGIEDAILVSESIA
jgi:hypothetical protein